jgi:hypothetical protein
MARNGKKVRVGGIVVRASPVPPECNRAALALADDLDPDTPVFSVDPHDPDLVIRELDGHAVRGYFKRGKFIEIL